MKTARIRTIAMTMAMGMCAGLHASVTEHQPPAPLPEFKTPEQLTKWRAETTAKTSAQEASRISTPDSSTPFYTGKPYLVESGSYAFKYREYNPEMGRWTTVDPSGFPDGANNRMYAAAPNSQIDRDGRYIISASINPAIMSAIVDWNAVEALAPSLVTTAMQHAESGTDWEMSTSEASLVKGSNLYSGTVDKKIQASLEKQLNGGGNASSVAVDAPGAFQFSYTQDTQLAFALHGIEFESFTADVTWNQNQWSANGNVAFTKYWDFMKHLGDFTSSMNLIQKFQSALLNTDGIILQDANLISPFHVQGSFKDNWTE